MRCRAVSGDPSGGGGAGAPVGPSSAVGTGVGSVLVISGASCWFRRAPDGVAIAPNTVTPDRPRPASCSVQSRRLSDPGRPTSTGAKTDRHGPRLGPHALIGTDPPRLHAPMGP